MRPSTSDECDSPAAPTVTRLHRHLVALHIDVDTANAQLIQLWLAAEGWDLAFNPGPGHAVDFILVEMAFPRHGDPHRIQALSRAWPGVPVIVLSPTFFADVAGQGSVAQELGAAAVLSIPLQRGRLVAVVDTLLKPCA